MFLPSDLYTLPQAIEKFGFTAEQILQWGVTGEIFFLVVSQGYRQGLCKVPQVALTEFINGDETVAVKSMPDVYNGELFGPCTIKREDLRIVAKTLDAVYATQEDGHVENDGVESDPRDDPVARPNYVDWDFWMKLPSVELWQATALAMGRNPDHLQYDSPERNFNRLLKITTAHAKAGNIRLVGRKLNMEKSLVSLSDFIKWLERMPLGVSEQFLSYVKNKLAYEDALKLMELDLGRDVETPSLHTQRNSTIKKRRNTLTPVIELAQKQCSDPNDTSEVWAAMLVLAEKKHAPLLGATEQGLQYLNEGTAAFFSKRSLRKRLAR